MAQNKTEKILESFPDFLRKDVDSNNYKLVDSFAPEFVTMDSEVVNLKSSIQLSTATGTELDDIGELFLLPRKGSESDTNYRGRIQAYWPGYSGGGTQTSIKQAITRLTDIPESSITITEYPTIALKFKVSATIPAFGADAATVQEVLQNSKAAGTYIIFDLTTSFTEYYNLYTESISIVNSVWIIPDYYIVESSNVPL